LDAFLVVLFGAELHNGWGFEVVLEDLFDLVEVKFLVRIDMRLHLKNVILVVLFR